MLLPWMAPETIQKDDFTTESDVWSYGGQEEVPYGLTVTIFIRRGHPLGDHDIRRRSLSRQIRRGHTCSAANGRETASAENGHRRGLRTHAALCEKKK